MNEQVKSFAFGDWTLDDILKKDSRLTNALFRIPDYQRGYAWEERQLEEFWEDLTSDKDRHYMGALTVERNGGESARPVYDVVDGQQRLTTISLLLSTLGNPADNPLFAPTPDGITRFGYADNNEDRMFFESLLKIPAFDPAIGDAVPDSVPPRENRSQKNLLFAKQFFSLRVAKECEGDTECKKKLFGRVFSKLVFDFRVLGDNDNAEIIFETMNNRGKPLTLLEKLKNRLMYLTEIATVEDESDDDETPNELRETINEAWGNVYRALASDPDRYPLDEDEFVASHLSVYRNPKESVYSETVAESRLFKMFCEHPEEHPISEEIDERQQDAVAGAEKEEPLSRGKIKDYVTDMSAFADAWAAIHQEFDSSCGQCRLLSDRRETKIFLAAVALHVQDESLREKIFEAARQILFRNTIDAGMDRTRFATLARRLHGVCVDQLKQRQRKELDGNGVLTELESVLVNEKKKPTKTTLIEFFANEKKGNFYGWSELGMRYFLMRHEEDYLDHDEKTTRRLKWEMFENVSVEHVLPQSSASKNSSGQRWWKPLLCDWCIQTTGKANPSDDELEAAAKMLSGTLGNLTLLTRKENSEVSNRPWDTYPTRSGKRDFYLDSNNCSSNGAVALAKAIVPQKWNAFNIRERGRELFRKLAVDFGVSDDLSNAEVDTALGFTKPNDANQGIYHLEDFTIDLLPEDVVAANVHTDEEEDYKEEWHRHWNAIPTDENKRLCFDFWTRFKNWCKDNGKTWCTRSVPQDGRPSFDPAVSGSAPRIHLFFTVGARSGRITNEGPLVTTGIYCREGDNQRETIKKYKGDFDKAFADCPPDFPDWDYVCKGRKAKRILFIRKADWTNPDATLFARMAADFEIVRNVLVDHRVTL